VLLSSGSSGRPGLLDALDMKALRLELADALRRGVELAACRKVAHVRVVVRE